jgi:hypothetical protein
MYEFLSKICIVLTCDKPYYNARREANKGIYSTLKAAGFDVVFLFAKAPNEGEQSAIHIVQDTAGYYTMTVPCEDIYCNLVEKMSYAYTFFESFDIQGILKIDDDVTYIDSDVLNPIYYSADYLGANSDNFRGHVSEYTQYFPKVQIKGHDIFFVGSFYWLSKRALSHVVKTGLNLNFEFAEDISVAVALYDAPWAKRFDTKWFPQRRVKWDTDLNYEFSKNTELCEIMIRAGSDKGESSVKMSHNYTMYYYTIFKDIKLKPLRVFELGIGTNNTALVSNMEKDGIPGASLYGWAEFFVNSNIYGADIDRDILFETDRIKTYYCDQTDPKEIALMWDRPGLEGMFDIIIDDGLHEPHANKCFFENSIHKLNVGGYYIIEDIQETYLYKHKHQVDEWISVYDNCSFELVYLKSRYNLTNNRLIVIKKLK